MKSESSQKMAISFPSNINSEMMMEWSGVSPSWTLSCWKPKPDVVWVLVQDEPGRTRLLKGKCLRVNMTTWKISTSLQQICDLLTC